jgi:hypothetical protein
MKNYIRSFKFPPFFLHPIVSLFFFLFLHSFKVKTEVDVFMVAFSNVCEAVMWSLKCQEEVSEIFLFFISFVCQSFQFKISYTIYYIKY